MMTASRFLFCFFLISATGKKRNPQDKQGRDQRSGTNIRRKLSPAPLPESVLGLDAHVDAVMSFRIKELPVRTHARTHTHTQSQTRKAYNLFKSLAECCRRCRCCV